MSNGTISTLNEPNNEEQIPLLQFNRIQLWNGQIFVICINTITVRPLQKFISTFAAFLMPIFGFTYTQIGYIIAARSYGGLFSIFLPSLIYWINTKCEMSFRAILFSLHTVIALLCGLFLLYNSLWFFIINRFLFGLLRTLFGVYRAVLGAAYSTKSVRMWVYSLFFTATPLSLPLLILFGILLQKYSFHIALISIFLPCFITGFALLYYLPSDPITHGINLSIGNINNENSLKYTYKILFDLNRIIKCIIRLLNGIYIQMFTVCISAWMADAYNINAGQYYFVIVAIFIAECIGSLTVLSRIHKKYECLQNGTILYAISVLFGVIVNFVIFLTESVDEFVNISFWCSLLLISLIYYAGTLMYIAGSTVTVVLVDNDNKKRSQYIAYNTLFFSAGILCGSLLGTSMYEKGGIWLVTQIGFYVSSISFILCCFLGYRMFKKDHVITTTTFISPISMSSMTSL